MSLVGDEKKGTFNLVIKWIVTFAIPISIWMIPVNDVYTKPMSAFLAATTFCIMLAAFELLPVLFIGLMLPALYIILGAAEPSTALGIWSNSLMMFMCIGAFVFANALDESGLLKRMVLWAGTKCHGSFTRLLFALLAAGMVIQFITFGNAWLICIVLCYGVVKALDLQYKNEGIMIMIVAQIMSTNVMGWVYSPSQNGLYQNGISMVFPDYVVQWWMPCLYGLPAILIEFIMVFLFIKLYKPERKLKGGQEYFEKEYRKLGEITGKEKKTVVILALMFIYLLTQPLHNLDSSYAFIFIPLLFFLPGIDIATSKSIESINISHIVFTGSSMGIGVVGGAVGIGAAISEYVTPLLQDCPKVAFLIGCVAFGVLMNILMTPMAMASMFPGPLAAVGKALQIACPLIPALAMFYANDMVFFPYENAFLLVMYGFNVMRMKDFIKYNVIKMVMFFVLFCILIIPYWYLLGLI